MTTNAPRFPWSEKDELYLLNNYHLKTIKAIGLIINKPSQAVVFKGKPEKALEIYNKTGHFCQFLTKRFGHEKPGYLSFYGAR